MEGPPTRYRLGDFVIDLSRGALMVNGAELPLRPKSFALLCYLAERAGQLVGRDEILTALWPGTFVTEDSITQCVRDIRRALGDDATHLLRTLPRRGFILAADAPDATEPPTESHAAQDTLPLPAAGRPMVLVLPFVNLGGDPEQDYFAEGLRADLITDLTRFQELQVIGLQKPEFPTEVYAQNACYAVDGMVRRAAGRVRVTAQLSDVKSRIALWSERFDRPLGDLFSLQDELTNHIAASIEIRVRREGLRRITRRAPASLDAYDLYLQGRALHALANKRDTELAARLLERAVAADPLYAPAHAWHAYNAMRGFTLGWGEITGPAALETALLSARRAVELEPELSPCMARVLALMGGHDEALDIAASGVRANPCDGDARATFGEVLSMSGSHAAGAGELQIAFDLNPFLPPFWRSALGRALLLAGRHAEALDALFRCRSEAPDYRPCHSSLVVALIETGQVEAAREAAGEVLRLRPGFRLEDYDGVFGFRRETDTQRFFARVPVGGARLELFTAKRLSYLNQ